MNSYALVNSSTRRVQTFVRPDLPVGYTPPEGYELIPDDQLPEGWQREEPPAEPTDPAAAWNAFLAGSITDSVTSIALKANRQARNDFIGQVTLLREALTAGAVSESTQVAIWDASNVEHTLTVADCLALLLRYGFAWQTAFNQLAP